MWGEPGFVFLVLEGVRSVFLHYIFVFEELYNYIRCLVA